MKLQITEEETRLFYLFVNYKNYTEEQIANVMGEITNPSEVARKITNFVTQLTKYEALTNESVDTSSLLINENAKKEYKEFKNMIKDNKVGNAFDKYSSNNMTYLDYINPNIYSKLSKEEKDALASIYGASLERFKEFVINVNYLARINNLVNKFNSNTLTKEDLESYLININDKKFRATQIYDWLYVKRVKSFDEMTNLSKTLISKLKKDFKCNHLELVKEEKDKDVSKYLFKLYDENYVELF